MLLSRAEVLSKFVLQKVHFAGSVENKMRQISYEAIAMLQVRNDEIQTRAVVMGGGFLAEKGLGSQM